MSTSSLPTFWLVAVLSTALLSGCDRPAKPTDSTSLPRTAVGVQRIQKKSGLATEEVVGTVRARLRSVIEAKVSGKIDKMLVVPGQPVKAGELLAELDASDIQARVEQARVVRQQAEADLKRFTTLWEQKILSQSEYDSARSKFHVAEAATLEAEALLSYTKVVAPFEGVITRKHVDVGDLASPGKPLLEMEDSRTLRFEADVPEAVANRIVLGDGLSVKIGVLETNLVGVVSEMAPSANPESRTFLVKLDLPQASGLRAGQFGRLTMPVGKALALRAPASAIVQRGQLELVFVVEENQARLRIVKTGKRFGEEVDVVSGLDADETIVTEGAAQLRDGQPIVILP